MRAHEFIKELVNPELRNTKKTVPHDLHNVVLRGRDEEKRGMYGSVKDTPNDPATVTKTIYNTEMSPDAIDSDAFDGDYNVDAYYLWVKACAQSGMMGSNPFIPRVYVIDDRQDSRGVLLPRYRIEKLIPIRNERGEINVSVQVLAAWLNQLAPDYVESHHLEQFIDDNDERTLWAKIQYLLRTDTGSLVDEQAIDAVALIDELLSWDDEIGNDMHTGNFMYRLTSVGPQLVITDPIAGEIRLSTVENFLNHKEWQ